MIYTCSLIFNSYSLIPMSLRIVPSASITVGMTEISIYPSVFEFSGKVKVPVFLFIFLDFHFFVHRNGKVHYSVGSLFFFDDYSWVWSSGQNLGICLYLKITDNLVFLFLQDGFFFVHIPFSRMV